MNYFAIDLGATSGRTMLCSVVDGKISAEEVSRFANPIIEAQNHCYWDILHLYREIVGGLATVARRGIEIESIGIDTWGVDFVCFGSDGAMLSAPLSYRDTHFGNPRKFVSPNPRHPNLSQNRHTSDGFQLAFPTLCHAQGWQFGSRCH